MPKQNRKPQVAIVFDTSYLMHPKYDGLYDNLALESCCEWTLFVPEQVSKEIRGHFGDENKDRLARGARKRVAELLEAGCLTPNLKDHEPITSGDQLGADSSVDQKLTGLAAHQAGTGRFDLVLLATDDGGISVDVAKLQSPVLKVLTKENIGQRQKEIEQLHKSWFDGAVLRFVVWGISMFLIGALAIIVPAFTFLHPLLAFFVCAFGLVILLYIFGSVGSVCEDWITSRRQDLPGQDLPD